MSIKLEARFHAWAEADDNEVYVVAGWNRKPAVLLFEGHFLSGNMWGNACAFARDFVESAYELLYGDEMEDDYDIETRIWMNMPPEGMHGLDEGDCVISCAEQNVCANGGILSQDIELYTIEDGRRLFIRPSLFTKLTCSAEPLTRELARLVLREAADDGV